MKPYFEDVKDLLAQYDTLEFNPAKGEALLTGKGWKKGGDGVWQDPQGNRLQFEVLGFPWLSALGQVVSEQLKKQGCDATHTMPPNGLDLISKAEYATATYGHGGSIQDPYDTLRLYQSVTVAVLGLHLVNSAKWKNEQYDKIVDDVYSTPMDQKQKLLELFHKAMAIWLPELPDVQLVDNYHTIPLCTKYWTGWPSDEDNYINEASWHLTFQLVLNRLEPTQ